jgi:hypothetical protein
MPDLIARLLTLAGTRTKEGEVESVTTPSPAARSILLDAESTATGCFLATRAICGKGCRSWEPESIWLTLERRGIDVPTINRDKILAAHTIMVMPAFWWEVNAFENTLMAFNNVLSDPETLQLASPAQIYWGVFEAEMLYNYGNIPETPEFDHEPISYTAAALHHAGLIYAPDILSFAQDELNTLNNGKRIIAAAEVDKAWAKMRQRDVSTMTFKEDSPLDVQLSRLAAIQLYVNDRTEQYQRDISSFKE